MIRTALFLTALLIQHAVRSQTAATKYPVDPASVEHSSVPKGEVLKFSFDQSAVFPGTWREYWIYIPAQYDPVSPASVYINQDGIQWNAPIVFDDLINSHEMPVTIGVFVKRGYPRRKIQSLSGNLLVPQRNAIVYPACSAGNGVI